MEHLLVKATVTQATDEGIFTAVISTVAIDRDRDIVEPAAVVAALQKWVPTGKKVPLSWNHSVEPQDIVGNIDPASAQAANGEVTVDGWMDQSTEKGQHAWRLVKSGTLGFSYGYLVTQADKRKDGGLHIKGLDIFEITATPIPANGETRVVSWKALSEEVFPAWALEAAAAGEFKAVWTTAYINDLPDSAFLYIEPGGEKDADGKTTPRSLRHFPYKDASGAVDLPHLRNALARIPQSSLSQDVKDRLTSKAQSILDNAKSVDQDEAKRTRSEDPLRKRSIELALELASDGMEPPKAPRPPETERPDLPPLKEQRRRSYDLMAQLLSDS